MEPRHTAKVVLVGDSGVGKSTILSSYRGERFNPCYMQTREREIKTANVKVGRSSLELQIWDTPGNDQCRTITAAYMRENVEGVIFVFDVTNDESYYNLHHWLKTVTQFAGNEHLKFVFVGNKNDVPLGRKVFVDSGEQLARQHNGAYIDASAKKNANIDQIFQVMAGSILDVESDQHASLPREPEPGDPNRSYEGEGGREGERKDGGFFRRCTVL